MIKINDIVITIGFRRRITAKIVGRLTDNGGVGRNDTTEWGGRVSEKNVSAKCFQEKRANDEMVVCTVQYAHIDR